MPSNSSTSIIGITAQESQSQQYKPVAWIGRNYGNLLIHHYVLYEKTRVAGRMQPQLILNCKNLKKDNLQLENPWKIPIRNFQKTAELQRWG